MDDGPGAPVIRRAAAPAILPVAALVTAVAAVTVLVVVGLGPLTPRLLGPYFALEGVAWLLFAAAVLLLRRVPTRAVAVVVLGGTLLAAGVGAAGRPMISSDSARYNWDGIVQDAGVSPYRYVPADAHLADLRPEWLFPTPTGAVDGTATCPGRWILQVDQVAVTGTVCTAINRPHEPTIYPPVAEALFALVRLPVPPDVEYLPTQLLGLAAVLATTALLLRTLRTTGRDPRHAAVFGWCPYVALEAVNNAHIDVVAAFLALAATVLVARGRRIRGGIVLGLAVATKFVPLLVAPPIGRRRPWTIAAAALGTVAAVYVPYLLGAGPEVIGYLPGYLGEEGYSGGTRSVLLSAVVPGAASTLVALAIVAALAVVLLIRTDPARPWAAQTLLIGVAFVALSPSYGWYALLLVPFVVMSGRWEWFALVIVLSLVGLRTASPEGFRALLLGAALAPVAGWWLRRRHARRGIADPVDQSIPGTAPNP